MFKNNLKIAWRNFLKNKVLSGIQILGLSLALATATLLYLTAMYELSFDNFHKDKERIGLLYFKSQPVEGIKYSSSAAAPLAPLLRSELSGIEKVSRYLNGDVILRHGDKQFQADNKYVDPDFLSIFSFSLLHGNEQALKDLNAIVINETMAKNLFGSTDVVGKQVEVYQQGQWQTETVAAVLEKAPANSDFDFQSLLRFEQNPDYPTNKEEWNNTDHSVFVKVAASKIDDRTFSRKARSFVKLYYKNDSNILEQNGGVTDENGDYLSMHLLPLSQYHLNNLDLGKGGSPVFPWILLLISGLVLFIACSNFINLSLADALTRNKEIGTRKTLGGSTARLIGQLWTESLFICMIALFLGLLLAKLCLKEYNTYMNYNLTMAQLFTPVNLILFLGVFFVLTLFAGADCSAKPGANLKRNSNHKKRGTAKRIDYSSIFDCYCPYCGYNCCEFSIEFFE